MLQLSRSYIFFFFNDTATTEIYTLSLHDALPISGHQHGTVRGRTCHRPPIAFRASTSSGYGTVTSHPSRATSTGEGSSSRDRKCTRLNSSHGYISYAVFCLKKKNRITDD